MKKKILVISLLSILTLSASGQESRFYTIGGERKRGKVSRMVEREQVFLEDGEIESVPSETVTQVEIDSLVAEYQRLLLLVESRKPRKAGSGEVLSYYSGIPRERSLSNLADMLNEAELDCKIYVLAQAVLESGWNLSSKVCREYNNLFGLTDAKTGDYYRFARWEDSVYAYKKFVQYKYKGGNYLIFLKEMGYAADKNYSQKVGRVAIALQNRIREGEL